MSQQKTKFVATPTNPDGPVANIEDWDFQCRPDGENFWVHKTTGEQRWSLSEPDSVFKRPRLYWDRWTSIFDERTGHRFY
jgi:hypothetical protein